jgi:NADP-dependent aldehyde dehydrogenase
VRLSGRSILGQGEGTAAGRQFHAANPTTGEQLEPGFSPATREEVDRAARLAEKAFTTYKVLAGGDRAAFLRTIASKIEAITSELVERAEQETALPRARLQSETARTCGQLRLFAGVVEEGSWVMARIDRADPERKPLPKPDVRSMLRPLGPVVVFGASNFPLAFSVAGGDTASALAAGNPVIVKAHPAHPGTSELVGRAVQVAVRECGLPDGTFSLLFDDGTRVGADLVQHPSVKAVGFTGSLAGGRALMDLAASRKDPIPVFAEMGSTNPVFILPGALRERGEAIATGLHSSFTLGAGQFCTKPGLVFLEEGIQASSFREKLREQVAASPQFKMLTAGICKTYNSAIGARKRRSGLTLLAEAANHSPAAPGGQGVPPGAGFSAGAVLFETDMQSFVANPELAAEVFGPTMLLVPYAKREEILQVAGNLEGHLTATIHGTEQDLREFHDLIAILETKVGRLVFNGFPTGVEVCHAMIHGGPYPATSDGRSTSVGSGAIFRFARPVCYQGFPDPCLPAELKNNNPLGIWRMVDGELTRKPA